MAYKQKGLQISSLLTLPLDAVTSTMVVYGGKGMGKTNFGGVLVEELSAAALKWSVLDPMGVWWGIRHSVDGKGRGVECLVLGGAHGDIPIEPTGGAVVADLVADEHVNVVIDISRNANGEMWSISDRIRFMTAYGKRLFQRQGSLIDGQRRPPMMQVIDEAARFIPQMIRAGQPELAMCTSTWSTIVEEGRNVGIGVTLLTQRSARLNKDVAELADMMLAFRTVGPNSLEAVTDWLSSQVSKQELRDMADKVRSLPVGSCLAVSPGWLHLEKIVPIRMRQTFDSSATPKPGQQPARVRGAGAKPDLAKYSTLMKETIERAKEDSVPELKKRIRELTAQIAKPAPAATRQVPMIVTSSAALDALKQTNGALKMENSELKRKLDDRQRKATKLVAFMTKSLKPMVEVFEKVMKEFESDAPVARIAEVVSMPEQPARRPIEVRRAEIRPPSSSALNGSAGERKLGGVALRLAQIVAGYGERGEGISKKLLATLAGVTIGGTFSARLSEGRSAGVLVTEGSTVRATAEGVAQYAGTFVVPSTTEEVVALWRPRLGGVAGLIFDQLVQNAGEPITRAELADSVGATIGGTFSARLSEVRSTGLLVENGSSVAINKELMFL